jgi:hypothetical protein
MADENRELEIKITTTADVGGVKQAEEAVKGLTSAAGNAAHGSGELGKEVKELGHQFHEAAGAGRVVAEVIHGNIGAIGHLGVAVKTIGTLLRTNLIGTLVTLGAVAAQVILPIIQGFDQAKKKIEDATKASEQLAKTNLDSLQRQLTSAAEGADELRKKFEAAQSAKERLDNAEKAARLAGVRADTTLSEVDKVKQESAINEEFRQRDQKRKIDALTNQVKLTDQSASSAREAANQPNRDFADALESRKKLREISAVRDELADLQKKTGGSREEANARGDRIAELVKQLAGKKIPTKEELALADKRVDDSQTIANAARAKIAEADRQARDARFGLNLESETQQGETEQKKKERSADLRAGLTAARAKDEERVGGFRAAREKIDQSAADEQRFQQDLEALKDQLSRRTGLSSDPANSDLVEAIKKKQAEISAATGQRTAAQAAFTSLTKDAPKSIVDESQKAAIDAAIQKSKDDKDIQAIIREQIGAMKELTAAIKAGGSAPADQSSAAPAQTNGDTATKSRGTINGVPVDEAIATRALNGAAEAITSASPELAAAHQKFADAVSQSRKDLKASLDRSRQQAVNQRETQ